MDQRAFQESVRTMAGILNAARDRQTEEKRYQEGRRSEQLWRDFLMRMQTNQDERGAQAATRDSEQHAAMMDKYNRDKADYEANIAAYQELTGMTPEKYAASSEIEKQAMWKASHELAMQQTRASIGEIAVRMQAAQLDLSQAQFAAPFQRQEMRNRAEDSALALKERQRDYQNSEWMQPFLRDRATNENTKSRYDLRTSYLALKEAERAAKDAPARERIAGLRQAMETQAGALQELRNTQQAIMGDLGTPPGPQDSGYGAYVENVARMQKAMGDLGALNDTVMGEYKQYYKIPENADFGMRNADSRAGAGAEAGGGTAGARPAMPAQDRPGGLEVKRTAAGDAYRKQQAAKEFFRQALENLRKQKESGVQPFNWLQNEGGYEVLRGAPTVDAFNAASQSPGFLGRVTGGTITPGLYGKPVSDEQRKQWASEMYLDNPYAVGIY